MGYSRQQWLSKFRHEVYKALGYRLNARTLKQEQDQDEYVISELKRLMGHGDEHDTDNPGRP